MNFNYFYRNNSPEFNYIKYIIWNYNNYIPPLPTNPNPTAICLKKSLKISITNCKNCNILMNIYLINKRKYIKKESIHKLCSTLCNYILVIGGANSRYCKPCWFKITNGYFT